MTPDSPDADMDVPTVAIFGDFNCPFSAVASARAARIERAGVCVVDWHAVEHAPTIPCVGEAVRGQLAEDLDHELAQIRALLDRDERDLLRLPAVLPNTHHATSAYAATPTDQRSETRQRLFEALWVDGIDLSGERVVDQLVDVSRDDQLAAQWRTAWLSLPQQLVPVMVLPDGYVSRGLGALVRLAEATRGCLDRLRAQ